MNTEDLMKGICQTIKVFRSPVPERKKTSERSFARQKEKRLSSDNEAHITYSFSAHYDV